MISDYLAMNFTTKKTPPYRIIKKDIWYTNAQIKAYSTFSRRNQIWFRLVLKMAITLTQLQL